MIKRLNWTKFSFTLLRISSVIYLANFLFLADISQAQQTEDSAIILMYHRFGEPKYPSTNITLGTFKAQLEKLKQEKYNVVALDDIVTAFRNKTKLPPRTIAITIDDAYSSILANAWPLLKEANFPFTLFVSTEPVSHNIPGYMTWRQIRRLASHPLVTIGHHSHTHNHLLEMTSEEAVEDIDKANKIYKSELSKIPEIFAYPFGEYSPWLENILKKKGMKAAFGQYSSAASSLTNLHSLPRFALNEKYSGVDRFNLIINARALPAYDILPINPVIQANPPKIGFTVDKAIGSLAGLSCYPSHLGKAANLTRIGQNRVEIRFDKPLPMGRSRINCTMPGPDKRWYWFGLPFFVK